MLFPDESYQIMGACFEVHNLQGAGFLEVVYQECLGIEFTLQKVSFVAQPKLQLYYQEQLLKQTYMPDFICYDKILVEIKAVDHLVEKHEAQVLNYLNATKLELGILINFGSHPKIEYKRLALSQKKPANDANKRE